jgi:phosphoglycolate phosphatase-like HAD superfamily hydrolase
VSKAQFPEKNNHEILKDLPAAAEKATTKQMVSKAIIFDIDGTLLDLQKAESQAYTRAFEVCFGLTGICDDWDSYPAHTDIALAKDILSERLGRPCLDREWQQIMQAYSHLLKTEAYEMGKGPCLVPGSLTLLQTLADRQDIGLALATGNSKNVAELRLSEAGIHSYFQCGGYAEDGDTKSLILRQSIYRCCELWPGLTERNIIYLGDREGDSTAALENGTHFFKMAGRSPTTEPYHYAHFLELDKFLSEIAHIWNG